MIRIVEAESRHQYEQAKGLIEEYVDFLGVDLEYQGFSKEIVSLQEMYGPPREKSGFSVGK